MLTINLFRSFPSKYWLWTFPSSLSLSNWMLRLCLGDGGLGLWKLKDIYKGQFHWDLALSGILAGFCLFMIHLHNKDNTGWKANTSQRQGQHSINKSKASIIPPPGEVWCSCNCNESQHFTRWLRKRDLFLERALNGTDSLPLALCAGDQERVAKVLMFL